MPLKYALSICTFLATAALVPAQTPDVRTRYQVKQVASSYVYLDGGGNDGLETGMRVRIWRRQPGEPLMSRRQIAILTIMAVAGNSSACEAKKLPEPILPGDAAELFEEDAQLIRTRNASQSVRRYPQVVAFSEGDPVEQELRDSVEKPPLEEINCARGRIGLEGFSIIDHATGISTFQEGLVLRADITRIAGSYWNLNGYWHGRLRSRAGGPATLNDLVNRTYQFGLYYNNPRSRNVAGLGRYLLPWAPSLQTIDGGYFARRVGKGFTAGGFAGSTPDPTAWNYNPDRQIAGAFAAFERGSFETVRFTSTAGAAVTRDHWRPERQFLFIENAIFASKGVSLYHNLEVDRLSISLGGQNTRPRLARSFLTLRLQAGRQLTFDLSHNYFRDIPQFDRTLIATGLLDRELFQGLSAGFRYQFIPAVAIYGSAGAAKRSNDAKRALNYMAGITLSPRPLPVRTELRYSRFDSSLGRGDYEMISFSRNLKDTFRVEFQAGRQTLRSVFTAQNAAYYGTFSMDYNFGRHYVLGAGWTAYRGDTTTYDQMFLNLGYRF